MSKTSSKCKELFTIIYFCFRLSLSKDASGIRRYFVLNFFLAVISVFLPFIVIYLSSRIIGLLATTMQGGEAIEADIRGFSLLCVSMFIIAVCTKIAENYKQYCDGMYRELLNNHLHVLMMEKTAGLDAAFFDSPVFYNEMRDAANNKPYIASMAFQAFDLLKCSVQLAVSVAIMSKYSGLFAVLLALSIIPHVILQKKQMDTMYAWQRGAIGDERKIYYLAEILFSREFVKDVKLFNLFPFVRAKYSGIWKSLFAMRKKLSFKYTSLLAMATCLSEVMMALFMLRMGIDVLGRLYTIGDYSFYMGIAGQILMSMYLIAHNYGQLMDGKARIENYQKFMNWDSSVKDDGVIDLVAKMANIEFRSVSFRYDANSSLVLNNVSFTLETPKKTAIVGVNGSGKSTIVKLLMRLYDPTEGKILINGIDIKDYTLESVRRFFSAMFQDYPSYAFTVKESVALSDYKEIDNNDCLQKALAKAGALSLADKLPNGTDTYLTRGFDDSGVELSGGQWQKISVARTFFREAPVMILDEPSAALDAESEDRLFRQIEKECFNKCCLLISHRLSNVIDANQILVLDKGEVIEQGIHAELMKQRGTYARLFNLQAEKYAMK